MNTYTVIVEGTVTETYQVQAESCKQAQENWEEGTLVNSEVDNASAISAKLDDEL